MLLLEVNITKYRTSWLIDNYSLKSRNLDSTHRVIELTPSLLGVIYTTY